MTVPITVPITMVEFPADDAARARRFWGEFAGVSFEERRGTDGEGWQAIVAGDGPALGIHERGAGPGDRFSLPYLEVDDLQGSLERVAALGGEVIHPGQRWAICRDSEGSPFGLMAATRGR